MIYNVHKIYTAFPASDIYYTNPQYYLMLEKPDVGDVSAECTVVISLLQKDYRRRKTRPGSSRIIVGFDVHLVSFESTCTELY